MFWKYAAAGIRTRVRDYFPAIVDEYKSRWEASVIATGPQPQFRMLNNGSSDILFMVLFI